MASIKDKYSKMIKIGAPRSNRRFYLVFGLALAIGLSFHYLLTNTTCLIRGSIGIPCPTCGLSRAYKFLLRGDVLRAFKFHPLFWLIPLVAIYVGYAWYTQRKMNRYILLSILIIFIGVYLWRMMTYFPRVEPMIINEKSYLFKLIRYFQGL